MKFYLYEEQYGGGCDYTIGCGKRLRLIEGVSTMAEAVMKATATTTDKYGDTERLVETDGERAIERARVLAVADEFEIDLAGLSRSREESSRAAERAAKEAAEKAEYERLRAKYA